MKKIVCELCEGVEFTKEGGMFVCQGCGTKYTPEEAKAMMKEVEGDAAPASAASASADSAKQKVANLLGLAYSAYESSNNKEAESYCNRVLEIDGSCYLAWQLRGEAICWQSQYGNTRVMEGARAMLKAVDLAPAEEKEGVAQRALQCIRLVCDALCDLAKDNFGNNPTEDNRQKFFEFNKLCANATDLFNNVSKKVKDEGYRQWRMNLRKMAELMNLAGVVAVTKAREKWNKIDHPNKDSLDTYLEWNGNICTVFRNSIAEGKKVDEDAEDMITRYENLIEALKDVMYKSSYKQEWSDWESKYVWRTEYSLADSAKESRNKEVRECEQAIRQIKQKEEEAKMKARLDAYWGKHKKEKEALDTKLKQLQEKKVDLEKQIAELDKQIKEISEQENVMSAAETELNDLRKQRRKLENERDSLGFFDGKEKKRLAVEIALLEQKISAVVPQAHKDRDARNEEIARKKNPLKSERNKFEEELSAVTKRIAAINHELTNVPA